ncbi:MAG: hypothetical protein NTX49_00875 [Chlamydiae bacterium]|nr:hypothetical protein [Chlamydiota bacterium]
MDLKLFRGKVLLVIQRASEQFPWSEGRLALKNLKCGEELLCLVSTPYRGGLQALPVRFLLFGAEDLFLTGGFYKRIPDQELGR